MVKHPETQHRTNLQPRSQRTRSAQRSSCLTLAPQHGVCVQVTLLTRAPTSSLNARSQQGMGSHRRWVVQHAWLPGVLSLLLLGALPAAVGVTTAPSDKAALLAFKAAITADQGLLSNWVASTDPCGDHWLGVSCRCSDIVPRINLTACAGLNVNPNDQRVVLLDFKYESATGGRYLSGQLAPEVANLTGLRHLNLVNNNLSVGASMPQHAFCMLSSVKMCKLH